MSTNVNPVSRHLKLTAIWIHVQRGPTQIGDHAQLLVVQGVWPELLRVKLDTKLSTTTNVIGQARTQFQNYAHPHVQSGRLMVGQHARLVVGVENGPDYIIAKWMASKYRIDVVIPAWSHMIQRNVTWTNVQHGLLDRGNHAPRVVTVVARKGTFTKTKLQSFLLDCLLFCADFWQSGHSVKNIWITRN